MLESVCGWSRPVDWGNAPSWAAVLVAAVVGAFTIANVLLARRAYVDGVEHRKVTQARLVWAEVGLHVGKAKGSRAADMGREIIGSAASLIGDSAADYGTETIDGKLETVLARDVTVHVVRIINNSSEPIGRVRLTLSGSKPYRTTLDGKPLARSKPYTWEHRPQKETARVIRPGEERQYLVVVPVPLMETDHRKRRVTIHFTDSAGLRWERTDTAPPKEIKPKRVRFPELTARKNRTVMRVRALRQKLWTNKNKG